MALIKSFRQNIFFVIFVSTVFGTFLFPFNLYAGNDANIPKTGQCWPPINQKKSNLILFIHGFHGSSQGTWKNSNPGGGYWPELIRNDDDPNFPELSSDFDVQAIDYDTESNYATVENIAYRLEECWETSGLKEYKGIYIICHSMGGLIAKKMLMDFKNAGGVPSNIKALITIATPQNGSLFAELLDKLGISRFLGKRLIDEMRPDSNFIENFSRDWQAFQSWRTLKGSCHYPMLFAATEQEPELRIFQIVRRAEAETYTEDGKILAFEGGHMDCVKPFDRNSLAYRAVKARIENTYKDSWNFCNPTLVVSRNDFQYEDSPDQVIKYGLPSDHQKNERKKRKLK